MNREQFLKELSAALKPLPRTEREGTLDFYRELIGDRVDAGEDESEVINSIDTPEEIAKGLLNDETVTKDTRAPMSRGTKTALIIAAAVGSPLWVSLIIAAFAVVFACAVACAAVIIVIPFALFAVSLSLACAFVLGIASAIGLFPENPAGALFQIGSSLFSLGASVFVFVAAAQVSKSIVKLLKLCYNPLKRFFCFISEKFSRLFKKEVAENV